MVNVFITSLPSDKHIHHVKCLKRLSTTVQDYFGQHDPIGTFDQRKWQANLGICNFYFPVILSEEFRLLQGPNKISSGISENSTVHVGSRFHPQMDLRNTILALNAPQQLHVSHTWLACPLLPPSQYGIS